MKNTRSIRTFGSITTSSPSSRRAPIVEPGRRSYRPSAPSDGRTATTFASSSRWAVDSGTRNVGWYSRRRNRSIDNLLAGAIKVRLGEIGRRDDDRYGRSELLLQSIQIELLYPLRGVKEIVLEQGE